MPRPRVPFVVVVGLSGEVGLRERRFGWPQEAPGKWPRTPLLPAGNGGVRNRWSGCERLVNGCEHMIERYA